MTVAELIEKLKGLPQDLPVVVEVSIGVTDGGGYEYVHADAVKDKRLNVARPGSYLCDSDYIDCVHIW